MSTVIILNGEINYKKSYDHLIKNDLNYLNIVNKLLNIIELIYLYL